MTDRQQELKNSLRTNRIIGSGLIGLFLALLIGWGVMTEINGAVVAQGTVELSSDVPPVQHREGGTITEILARDGDLVTSGQLIARVDTVDDQAQLSIIQNRQREASAREARLKAEYAEEETLSAVADLTADDPIVIDQQSLLTARTSIRKSWDEAIAQQQAQLDEEAAALDAQRSASDDLIAMFDEELSEQEGFLENGLVTINRTRELRRDIALQTAENTSLVARRAQIASRMNELEIERLRYAQEWRAEVLGELRAVQAELTELEDQFRAAQARVERGNILAPRNGTVHASILSEPGGVIRPGEAIMVIVPDDEEMTIQARIAPGDLNAVSAGQDVQLRFPALDMPLVSQIDGTVEKISADRIIDDVTGEPFFEVEIALSDPAQINESGATLGLGSPVEAFIQTDARMPLAYLTKPLTDQLARVMRD